MTTKTLLAALTALEGRPWADLHRGRAITDRFLGQRLKRFGVSPRTIRVGEATPKGYLFADLTDAFQRYLPAAAATSATSLESLHNHTESHPPRGAPVADADLGETLWDSAHVADVAVDEGGCCPNVTGTGLHRGEL